MALRRQGSAAVRSQRGSVPLLPAPCLLGRRGSDHAVVVELRERSEAGAQRDDPGRRRPAEIEFVQRQNVGIMHE